MHTSLERKILLEEARLDGREIFIGVDFATRDYTVYMFGQQEPGKAIRVLDSGILEPKASRRTVALHKPTAVGKTTGLTFVDVAPTMQELRLTEALSKQALLVGGEKSWVRQHYLARALGLLVTREQKLQRLERGLGLRRRP